MVLVTAPCSWVCISVMNKGYNMQRNDDRAKVALAALRTPRGLCTLRMRRRQAARPASAAP